jgi:hypothetical protein
LEELRGGRLELRHPRALLPQLRRALLELPAHRLEGFVGHPRPGCRGPAGRCRRSKRHAAQRSYVLLLRHPKLP